MASNIPTRRVTRTTRTTTLKDNENANARPSRLTARVKPPSSNGSAKANGNDENKVNLAAQGKRKREALGEVTRFVNKNKTTNVPAKEVKGKRKEADPVKEVKEKFDGVVIKSKPSLVAAARQPLCTVSGSTTRLATRSTVVAPQVQNLDKVKEESGKVADEDAMAIDDHPTTNAAPSAEPQPRRVSTRRSNSPANSAPAKHEDDVEDNRVFKKRRTSSDIPDEVKLFEQEQLQQEAEEAALEAYADSEPEADPYGDQWDDLDAEDADDHLMVSEYVIEIFNYMKEIELTTMPNPNYMESQKELAWKMRGILTDWLVQVHVRFRLLPETLFLCVNLIDRFLSARVVSLAKLQLVGITCLFVAAKVEEIVAPSVAHFLYCADSSYTYLRQRLLLKTGGLSASFGEYNFDLSDRKLFKFALDPPTLASEEQGRLGSWARDLKDWGASPGVTDWDYFTLDDLSSFESTDFEYLSVYFHSYDRKRPGKINRHESEIQDPEPLTDEARTSRCRARSLSQEPSPNDLVRPSKRTHYDISPLFTVIPQVRGLLA
ncbi:hypothetical protein SERLADRAFT_438877 [Serpula lacrymans var. lacrymans S7.9]|uniref:Cyclin-like domain-containing protein n=1 Tax=Serpula lacrymans var. lacrymans (strain S7.9) TaxID=578457 RepID=F8NY85_SERL9|nr:uncharacterized protein SERLADRAFT_438877 [Serpula lacrymans var. lacrymans S7.9]EGO23557.1 hypothetical protein SERLADRAFT_438877 [Serpula lacrymans var. lacrymans S7.9]